MLAEALCALQKLDTLMYKWDEAAGALEKAQTHLEASKTAGDEAPERPTHKVQLSMQADG